MRYLIILLAACSAWGQWTGKAIVGTLSPNNGSAFTDSSAPANGDMVAQCGNLVISDGSSSGTITDVGFRFGGTITKAGGSTVMVSLQDADTAAGPPIRPDGTPDQSYTIANADAGFAANAAYLATLGSTRSVSVGDLFCVVLEYASYGGADVFSVSSWAAGAGPLSLGSSTSRLNTATWVDRGSNPNVYFVLSGGKYGAFVNSFFVSSIGTTSWNSTSSPDEYASEFTVAQAVTIDMFFAAFLTGGASSNFEVVLYGDASTIATCSRDASTVQSSAAIPFICVIAPTLLSPGVTYRISVKPTTANNVSIRSITLPSADLRALTPFTTEWSSTSRTDGGSWSAASTTTLYWSGYRIVATAASSGGSFAITN